MYKSPVESVPTPMMAEYTYPLLAEGRNPHRFLAPGGWIAAGSIGADRGGIRTALAKDCIGRGRCAERSARIRRELERAAVSGVSNVQVAGRVESDAGGPAQTALARREGARLRNEIAGCRAEASILTEDCACGEGAAVTRACHGREGITELQNAAVLLVGDKEITVLIDRDARVNSLRTLVV